MLTVFRPAARIVRSTRRHCGSPPGMRCGWTSPALTNSGLPSSWSE
jgi:hypothetical protein